MPSAQEPHKARGTPLATLSNASVALLIASQAVPASTNVAVVALATAVLFPRWLPVHYGWPCVWDLHRILSITAARSIGATRGGNEEELLGVVLPVDGEVGSSPCTHSASAAGRVASGGAPG